MLTLQRASLDKESWLCFYKAKDRTVRTHGVPLSASHGNIPDFQTIDGDTQHRRGVALEATLQ